MSNDNHKVQAEQATSQENENMNTGTIVTEIDTLTAQVEELKLKLAEETEKRKRFCNYWIAEEKKVKLLLNFIKSGVNGRECMTAGDLIAKLIDKLV